MKKYRIIESRPELSSKDIEKGMDFAKIQSSVPKPAKLSFTKIIAVAGTVTVVAIGVIAAVIFNKGNNNAKVAEAINRPMPLNTSENPLKQYKINAQKDTVILHETGTQIRIPQGAFVDSTGKSISGEVDIDYREFHNIGQIVLAGIPMTYDSAGVQSHFESAGMFEITGTQHGHPVFIDPSKSLEVQMASLNSDTSKFNKYFFNPEKNNWEYIAEDVPSILKLTNSPKSDSLESGGTANFSESENASIAGNEKIIKPVKQNNNKQQFTLDVDPARYPELSVFNKVIFEVSPKTKNFDPADASKNWYDAEIERIEKSSDYKITFKGFAEGQPTSLEVIGYPVVDENNYAAAIKKYNQLNENYEKKLDKKKQTESIEEGKLTGQLDQYVDAMNRYRQLVKENYQLVQQAAESSQMVYRTFQVQNFGIFNSDCPKRMPEGLILAADFQNQDGKAIEPVTIYLVEKGNNTLYTFYPGKPIYLNPSSDNVLMIITKDNSLGWVKNDAIGNIDKSAKKHNFKMNTVRKSNYSMSDINNLLL